MDSGRLRQESLGWQLQRPDIHGGQAGPERQLAKRSIVDFEGGIEHELSALY